MSQKNVSTTTHGFNVEYATLYGIECAIMIGHFIHWIELNQRLGQNFKEGKTWTFQTQKWITAHFPYWTEDQVYKIIKKLEDNDIIEKGNFNKVSYDRTIWYSFKNEELFIKSKTLPSNDGMDCPIRRNGIRETTEPIPDTKTDTIKDTTTPNPEVVVFSDLKISESLKKKLLKTYTKHQIELAVKRTKAFEGRRNDEAVIQDILLKGDYWNDNSKEDILERNLKFIETIRKWDGITAKTGWKFDVCNKYVEFSFCTNSKLFEITEKDFIDDVNKTFKKLEFI